MIKKYSLKFWIIFWGISILLLAGWFFYWQTRFGGLQKVSNVIGLLPVSEERRDEYKTLFSMADYFLAKDNTEKTFLILFQNNMEIRPGGGYIGSFGILKLKNGQVESLQTHDLSNFDGRIPDGVKPPYPMEETLNVHSWKLRDSNWSPDFPTNAKKAEEFYYLGQGEEKFDGIIGITSSVLASFLKVTGPVQIEGYPGTFDSENAIISLEYQVEKGYAQQGIEKGERKSVMNMLAQEIMNRVSNLGNAQKLELAKIILEDLQKKDIQFYFKNSELEKSVEQSKWGGEVDENWNKDYLMVVDANLGAYKSDYYVKRSIDYSVDLSKDVPEVKLLVSYNHTAKQKDWMTNNYQDYLRVYAPNNFWLSSYPGLINPHFAEELGKKYFGFLINVPIGAQKTYEFNYTLPKELKDNYDLKIQKQAGINDVPVSVHITEADGKIKNYGLTLNSDVVLSEIKN
jgi:hypothetical protein